MDVFRRFHGLSWPQCPLPETKAHQARTSVNIAKLLTKSARTFPDNLALATGPRGGPMPSSTPAPTPCPGPPQAGREARRPRCHPDVQYSRNAGVAVRLLQGRLRGRAHQLPPAPQEFAFIIDHSEAAAVVFSPEFNEPMAQMAQAFRGPHLIAVEGAEGEPGTTRPCWRPSPPVRRRRGGRGRRGLDLLHLRDHGTAQGRHADPPQPARHDHEFLRRSEPGLRPRRGDPARRSPVHGSGLYALPNIGKAAANVIPESRSFDPEEILAAVRTHRVTNMFAAPTMIKRLVDSPAMDRHDCSSLKTLNYGGGPMLAQDLCRP